MAYLVNKDFTEIAADGHNYLLWAINIKIMLKVLLMISINLIHKPIFQTQPNIVHYFLRHHLHVYLKIYVKDPCKF